MSQPSISRRSLLAGGVGAGALGVGASVLKRGPESIAIRADSSDWPLVGHDARNTGYNPHASGPDDDPQARWRADRFDPEGAFRGYLLLPTPVVVGERLFVGGPELSALRVDDGSEIWSVAGADDETFHGTAFAGGSVFVTTLRDGETPGIAAVDATGERGWRREITTRFAHPPQVAGETVYVPSYDYLAAFDRASGSKRWRLDTDSVVSAQPAVTDDGLYTPMGWSGLFARERRQDLLATVLNDPPDTRWRYEPEQEATSAPAVGDNRVFVPETQDWHPDHDDEEGRLAALTRDGERLWDEPGGTFGTSPVVVEDTVYHKCAIHVETVDMGEYVTSRSDARVTARDAADGTARWTRTFESLGNWRISPVSDGDRVYVPLHDGVDEESVLVALDAATGETRWELALDAPAYHLALAGETLYVTTSDGTLHALD